jgi:ribose-phosphate pyrophosphokinase
MQTLRFRNPLAIASPDVGGLERAQKFMEALKVQDLVLVYKSRTIGDVKTIGFIGNCKGRDVIIVDDIVDSGNTLKSTAELLRAEGACKIVCCVTHGIFSVSPERICADMEEFTLVVTNTVNSRAVEHEAIKVLDVSELFSKAISRIHLNQSVSELFRW